MNLVKSAVICAVGAVAVCVGHNLLGATYGDHTPFVVAGAIFGLDAVWLLTQDK